MVDKEALETWGAGWVVKLNSIVHTALRRRLVMHYLGDLLAYMRHHLVYLHNMNSILLPRVFSSLIPAIRSPGTRIFIETSIFCLSHNYIYHFPPRPQLMTNLQGASSSVFGWALIDDLTRTPRCIASIR